VVRRSYSRGSAEILWIKKYFLETFQNRQQCFILWTFRKHCCLFWKVSFYETLLCCLFWKVSKNFFFCDLATYFYHMSQLSHSPFAKFSSDNLKFSVTLPVRTYLWEDASTFSRLLQSKNKKHIDTDFAGSDLTLPEHFQYNLIIFHRACFCFENAAFLRKIIKCFQRRGIRTPGYIGVARGSAPPPNPWTFWCSTATFVYFVQVLQKTADNI
jgi:hypothetical protein